MNNSTTSQVLAVLLSLTAPVWALNFTPKLETELIDGYPIQFYSFEDGAQRVGYGPPPGWRCSGSSQKLILEDPHHSEAQATLSVLPNDKPGPFSPENLQAFKSAALALLPSDSVDPVFAEVSGKHTIGNGESYTVNLTYGFYGKKYATRIIFVNLGNSFLKIICTAPSDAFAPFIASLDSSFCSWHQLKS